MSVRLQVYQIKLWRNRFMKAYHDRYRELCEEYGSDRVSYGENEDRQLVIWMYFDSEEEAALFKLTHL